jgi:putative transposase
MRDVYAGIDQLVLTESFRASAVRASLEVSRSGFYAWRSGEESHREARDRELVVEIRQIFWQHRRRYGARRIAAELRRRGTACGVARFARLLKPGFAGDSAEVVSATHDRQPTQFGLQRKQERRLRR